MASDRKVGKKRTATVRTKKKRDKKKLAKTPAKKTKKKKHATSTAKVAKKVARKPKPIPPPKPSGRALAICAQFPKERSLSDEEREAMVNVAAAARRLLGVETEAAPADVVSRIGGFVDEVRFGRRTEPKSQDVRLGLGVLWGEQVRTQVGWTWVHLTYPDGFKSYGLVPDDRAFACFPLNRIAELMRAAEHETNTSLAIFQGIVSGELPGRKKDAYLVIG